MPPITVWIGEPSIDELRAADRAMLSPEELDRMNRLAHIADQDRFSSAWALTRRTLGLLTGSNPRQLSFERRCNYCGDNRHGKPRLVNGTLEFSLAHAGRSVLLAVAEVPVGVDVEPIATRVDDLLAPMLHHSELHVVQPDLIRLWVRKEAVLKATGHGLVRPMKDFSVLVAPKGMFLADVVVQQDYVAAVAVVSDRDFVVKTVWAAPESGP